MRKSYQRFLRIWDQLFRCEWRKVRRESAKTLHRVRKFMHYFHQIISHSLKSMRVYISHVFDLGEQRKKREFYWATNTEIRCWRESADAFVFPLAKRAPVVPERSIFPRALATAGINGGQNWVSRLFRKSILCIVKSHLAFSASLEIRTASNFNLSSILQKLYNLTENSKQLFASRCNNRRLKSTRSKVISQQKVTNIGLPQRYKISRVLVSS